MEHVTANKSKIHHRWIATFFLTVFVPTLIPSNSLFASNNGPNAPEAASFEPVDATDMVSLATGDMAYALPLLTVPSPEGGYPLVLSYHGGIGFDQEASMVGLGWNLNPGAINRNINGEPDDWKGAHVRDREEFSEHINANSLSTGYGTSGFSAAIGYSWDSNGTKKGTLSVNYSNISVGVGYSNKDGWDGSLGLQGGRETSGGAAYAGIGVGYSNSGWKGTLSTGYGTEGGYSFGTYADTDGVMSLNFAHDGSSTGASIYSNKGQVGVGLSAQGSRFNSNQSGSSSTSSWGFSAGLYFYGFFLKFAHQETEFERSKTDDNYVYGPLYYSALPNSNTIASGSSYPNSSLPSHKRDHYMDAYSTAVPYGMPDETNPLDVFGSERPSYNAPSYDYYEVSAQGLSGTMSPRMASNGLIINAGADVEVSETKHGRQCSKNNCPGYENVSCTVYNVSGERISRTRKYVNSHYSVQANHQFLSNVNFYFNYQFPSTFKVNPMTLDDNSSTVEGYFSSQPTSVPGRKENVDYIETFTNAQVANAITSGQFLEAKGYDRVNDKGYIGDGIGGYKITTADGKTYHYSRPVYQFEQIFRQMAPDKEESSTQYREVQRNSAYATHWLLTAVTGPDYVKNTTNPYPEDGDYGYWVRFDYGTWTDGYMWRTPSSGYTDRDTSPAHTAYEYSFGRKQLVYLDKVVTRTHTALFIKSLRKDDLGARIGGNNSFPSFEGDQAVDYPSQKSLKLDEIILVKNSEMGDDIEPGVQYSNLTNDQESASVTFHSMYLDTPIDYQMNQQNQILDPGDLEMDPATHEPEIYAKAVKIVRFNQDYRLAQNSPNSTAPQVGNIQPGGRLTLQSLETLGKGGESYMMPYTFEYVEPDTPFDTNQNVEDDWGYKKNNPMLWTLNKINLPTGSAIEFEYEEDEFYTEALSRKMFNQSELAFKMCDTGGLVPDQVAFTGRPWDLGYGGPPIDFTKYFSATDPEVYASLFCCHDEPGSDQKQRVRYDAQVARVVSVTDSHLVLEFSTSSDRNGLWDGITGCDWLCEGQTGSVDRIIGETCQGDEGHHGSYTFKFNIIANKTPESGFGGGIRVKRISTVTLEGKRVSTDYRYNHPTKDRTSGITTYAPSKNLKYVAYRTEVPGPRVMYEYVTVTDRGNNNEPLGKIQYQFDVIKPVVNVFDPNIRIGEHFQATTAPLSSGNGTQGANIKLEDNFATIGNVVKVTQFNNFGQIISQSRNHFQTLSELQQADNDRPGFLQESFHSLSSVYRYRYDYLAGEASAGGVFNWNEFCFVENEMTLEKRLASSSTKITYPVVQKRNEVITAGKKRITEYSGMDLKTGQYLVSKTTLADGTRIKTQKMPAYTKYPDMGSKVVNPNFKNMLTQEATSKVYVSNNNADWRLLDFNLTAWKKDWGYRKEITEGDTNPLDEVGVWRIQKRYKWKEDIIDSNGTFVLEDDKEDYFDWNTNLPGPKKNGWKKIAENSKYNHFSAPIESKDINENFASSKMADKNTKVIVAGNARYTEMYYSGAEYVKQGNIFEGEVQGANFRTNLIAHTGMYAVKGQPEDKVFEVTGESGKEDYYQSPEKSAAYRATFRPGKYKVSFWSYIDNNCTECKATDSTPEDEERPSLLTVNGNPIRVSEIVQAGCWQQLNYYFDIPASRTLNSIVVSPIHAADMNIYDDFRMHPVASTVTSYVYDNKTDHLTYMLDNNNMGTAYLYDNVGRLAATYKENINSSAGFPGFRLVGQYKQVYPLAPVNVIPVLPKIGNCSPNAGKFELEIKTKSVNTLDNKFTLNVTGGSGNYQYQVKRMLNLEQNNYSPFTFVNEEVEVPYLPNYCNYNSETGTGKYAKNWRFVAKVKDLTTNEIVEKEYSYKGDCTYQKLYKLDSDLQISKSEACNAEKVSFKIHLKDPGLPGNFKYEYAYYNPNLGFENQNLQWIDITASESFCPSFFKIADAKCDFGYRPVVYFTFRVTELTTGETSNANPYVFFGECPKNSIPYLTVPGVSSDASYQESNRVLVKGKDGKVINFYSISN